MAKPVLPPRSSRPKPPLLPMSRRSCGRTAPFARIAECRQKRIGRLNGKTTRPGLHKCYACKKPFTVRMGTHFRG